MPLVSCKEMVTDAYANGYAVAQLNANGGTYDLARAMLEAAEELRSPLIVGAYESNCEYAGIDYVGANLQVLIERFAPSVPVAIHLDHGHSVESTQRAAEAGFTSVMFDGSQLPLAENIAVMKQVCDMAHERGLTAEGELGHLLDGTPDPDNVNVVRVSDVRAFTAEAPVDMLAVAIGNSHGFYKGEPKLNMERLREVRQATDVPLVLHGTTGLKKEQIRECISLGMAKVNLGTILRTNYIKHYQDLAATFDHQGHPWRIAEQVKNRMKDECAAFLRLVGSNGKA